MDIDKLIESIPFVSRQLAQYGNTGVNMADSDYRELVGESFYRFFTNVPNGETSTYLWETVKVDYLKNLKIYKKVGSQKSQQSNH